MYTTAVNQTNVNTAFFFSRCRNRESRVSVCNYSLVKPASVSFQLCSVVNPGLISALCFINMLLYPFILGVEKHRLSSLQFSNRYLLSISVPC